MPDAQCPNSYHNKKKLHYCDKTGAEEYGNGASFKLNSQSNKS